MCLDPHDRDVERAAAEIENENGLIFIQFIEAVGQRRRRRLVDNLENIQSGELAGRDRRRALRIIEICRDGDHGVRHRFLQIFFRVGFELFEDERRKFFRRINLAVEFAMKLFLRLADLALNEIDDPLRFRDRIILGERADDDAPASNRITDGVMRSLSALGMICGLP